MYNSMNYIGKFISNFRDFYNEINAATLTGAIDVVVVQQPDGSYTCSPFHVRFGKLGVLRSREKVVDIEINSEPRQIHMKLGDSGEAFFVEEVAGSDGSPSDSDIPPHLACSPIPNDDDCLMTSSNASRFNVLSDLPQEQHEKILRDSVMSIEREKWEQMSALPADERETFLIEHFSDLPIEQREKWLQIASLTTAERDKMFHEYYGSISTVQKQRMISEQYSALKTEDRERLFKENFPELPAEQRQSFEKALLSDWQPSDLSQKKSVETIEDEEEEAEEEEDDDEDKNKMRFNDDEEIFDMENVNSDEKPKAPAISNPKSFVAVTSSEKIRKISVVNNDFRPIVENDPNVPFYSKDKLVEEESVGVYKPLSSSSSSSSAKRSSKDESTTDEIKSSNSNSKRKKKRKSTMKRKNTQRKISNSANNDTVVSASPAKISPAVAPVIEIENPLPDKSESKATPKDEVKNIPEEDQLNKINITHPPTDFHFFSDTEITTKNKESRPNSPIQSDTEFEVQKITQESNAEINKAQSWRWGELPSPAHDGAVDAHGRPLNPTDANVTNTEKKTADEEDAESGNGPSLPQSPNSVEGAIGGPKSLDSDFDESSSKQFESSLEVQLSLCGGLDPTTAESEPSEENFQRHAIRFEDICTDPKIFENPNLVVKVNNKYYNWAAGCAIVMTYVALQKHLPNSALSNLHEDRKRSASDSKVDGRNSNRSTTGGGYSSWFTWRRSSQPAKKSPNSSFGKDDAAGASELNLNEANVAKEDGTDSNNTTTTIVISEANKEALNEQLTNSLESIETSQSLVSFSDAVEEKSEAPVGLPSKEADREGYCAGNEEEDDSEEDQQPIHEKGGIDIPTAGNNSHNQSAGSIVGVSSKGTQNFRKTLRLSSEQIASLDLKEGVNEVVFSVTTAYQGTTRCKCFIYKWRWDDKIVISDIDGTITKSDVLGHILPIVGKDWAQSGVAQLFTKIKNNGYKLLYLSARAIGQARHTREYLKSIRQGELSLPDGPLLLNPTSLISAFHREVIEKKPEQFKISCLSDIKALFPDGSQPFYAGYGNRINDVWAYRAVGIPTTRIFTINHRGELKHELTQTFQSTYSNMSYIVDHVFPAIREDAEDFSNFSYWREPIQHLEQTEMLAVQN